MHVHLTVPQIAEQKDSDVTESTFTLPGAESVRASKQQPGHDHTPFRVPPGRFSVKVKVVQIPGSLLFTHGELSTQTKTLL